MGRKEKYQTQSATFLHYQALLLIVDTQTRQGHFLPTIGFKWIEMYKKVMVVLACLQC